MIYERESWQLNKRGRMERKRTNLHKRSSKSKARALEKLKEHEIEWNARLAVADPISRQIPNLIAKFGGIVNFAIAVGETPDKILWAWLHVSARKPYKVTMERYGGRMKLGKPFGILHHFHLIRIIRAARYFGILLEPQDIFPELIENNKVISTVPDAAKKDYATWTRRNTGTNATGQYQEFEDLIARIIEPE